jgi:RNA polymerase primary sigma factor
LELRSYLSAIRRYPLLTRTGEHRLALESRQGVEAARRALVEGNLRLVVKIAMGYQPSSLPVEDLVSEGNIGLMEAARRYDPSRGVPFASYAAFWIKKYVVAALERNTAQSSLPLPETATRRRIASLDSLPSEDGEARAEDPRSGPEDLALQRDLEEALRSVLYRMPAAERTMLASRFGLDGEPARTLQEVGTLLGCTRERARQIERRALERARRLLER